MKKILFIFLLIQISLSVCAQKTNWAATHNWKIYRLSGKQAYSYSVDTLSNFKSAKMGDSTIIAYLAQSKSLPKGKGSFWMGVFIATYETSDKKLNKVALSNYGGFFFDFSSKVYYELPEKSRQSWYTLINQSLEKVFEGKNHLE